MHGQERQVAVQELCERAGRLRRGDPGRSGPPQKRPLDRKPAVHHCPQSPWAAAAQVLCPGMCSTVHGGGKRRGIVHQVAPTPQTKGPARGGAEFAFVEFPLSEPHNHRGFAANLVSFPCITCAEMSVLRRKGLAQKNPRYGGSGASPVPRSPPRNLVGDGHRPSRKAYDGAHNTNSTFRKLG